MHEETATSAIKLLKEILSKESLFPISTRKAGAFEINNYIRPSRFGVPYNEALEIMNNFQNRGLLIITADISTPNPISTQNNERVEHIFFKVDTKSEAGKRISYEVQDIEGLKSLIKTLSKSSDITIESNEAIERNGSKVEISVEKLTAHADGSIRYDGKVLTLRGQIKDLCWLFMRRQNQLINADDIKEAIIDAPKRKAFSWHTISKYVYELHSVLKIQFGKRVIVNERKGGWIFHP